MYGYDTVRYLYHSITVTCLDHILRTLMALYILRTLAAQLPYYINTSIKLGGVHEASERGRQYSFDCAPEILCSGV
jgi:hypothetical protein